VARLPPHFTAPVAGIHTAEYGPRSTRVGGIDFGFRNPFAAIWAIVDQGGVLWLTGEHLNNQLHPI